MRTQLQAISLRIQTVRSNEQMMQSMKGATSLLGSMNRQMNLPALQRIAMEFEKENDIMDQRQEMMDDAIDDVTGLEDEEEGEEVVKEVLDEIGVDLGQAVCFAVSGISGRNRQEGLIQNRRWARRRKVYRRMLSLKAESRKPSVVVAAVEGVVEQRTMTICKQGWTAYGDESRHGSFWRLAQWHLGIVFGVMERRLAS